MRFLLLLGISLLVVLASGSTVTSVDNRFAKPIAVADSTSEELCMQSGIAGSIAILTRESCMGGGGGILLLLYFWWQATTNNTSDTDTDTSSHTNTQTDTDTDTNTQDNPEFIQLYRVISQAELDDLLQTNAFNTDLENVLSCKWFAETYEAVLLWELGLFPNGDGRIVEITVLKEIADT